MQHITMHLIDSLIAREHAAAAGPRSPSVHKRMSMIAPGGISDDDGGDGEIADDASHRNCCKALLAKCRCRKN
jgi:hypothetical protein